MITITNPQYWCRCLLCDSAASYIPSGSVVKNLPWVGSLGPWVRALEKEWQPTPVFLPGESHGQRSLEGYSPQGHKESDMTKQARMPFLWLPSPNSHWLLSLLCLKLRDPVIA